jgi:fibronectin-binding autotransporter adhesin
MKSKSPLSLFGSFTNRPAAVALAVALSSLLSNHGAKAADFTWSGATNGTIGTASNWSGGVLPSNPAASSTLGDRWVFGASSNTTLTGARTFAGMIFNAGAPAYTIGTTSDNVTWNVTGSAITNNSSNVQTINYNLAMAQGRTFTGSTAGGDIIANGLLSGAGNITKSGTNKLTVTNAGSTISNNFIVNGGGTLAFGAVGTTGAAFVGTSGARSVNVTGATLAAQPGVALTVASSIVNLNMNTGAKFTMVDGVYNTFGVTGTAANGYAGTAGTAPTYSFDIGGTSSADVLAFTGTPTFTNAGSQLFFTPVSALTVGNSYTVVTAAGGLNVANSFVLGSSVAVFGNTSYTLSISNTATTTSIGVTAADLAKAFYSGAQGTTLNAGAPGVSTNWLDAASSGSDTLIQPSAATEFHFAATGATNTTIATLGQDYSALSLNFNGNAGVSINDTASNKITVGTGGINVTGGTHSINVPLTLSAAQSFTNNSGGSVTIGGNIDSSGFALSSNSSGAIIINGNITNSGGLTKDGAGTLTIAGTIGGTGGLIKNGSGSLVLNNSNGYSGATAINLGTVTVSTIGAFGTDTGAISMGVSGAAGITYTGTGETSTRNFATSGALINTATFTQSGASGLLKLSGNFTSITANNRNFVFAGSTAGTGEVSGVISNQSGGGGQNTQVTKNGTGTWTFSGPNTYTFTTTINDGTLRAGVATVAGVSGAFGINSGISLANTAGATLDLNGFDTQVGSISGGGATGGNITLGSATLTTGAGANPYSGAISGTGGLIKIGTGNLALAGTNSYTGATQVNAGTLTVTGSLANTALTVGGAAATGTPTLAGGGTIGGATVIAAAGGGVVGIHAPGVAGVSNGVGTQTFSNTLNYDTGSIFEWNLNAPGATDPGAATANSGTYDQVSAAGAITGGAAIYKVVLSGNAFTDTFWSTSKSWNNVFTGAGTPANLAAVFSSFDPSGGLDSAGVVTGIGSFSFNGSTSTLNWTPVPEPTSALAGLLLGAGLLRRRRA